MEAAQALAPHLINRASDEGEEQERDEGWLAQCPTKAKGAEQLQLRGGAGMWGVSHKGGWA